MHRDLIHASKLRVSSPGRDSNYDCVSMIVLTLRCIRPKRPVKSGEAIKEVANDSFSINLTFTHLLIKNPVFLF